MEINTKQFDTSYTSVYGLRFTLGTLQPALQALRSNLAIYPVVSDETIHDLEGWVLNTPQTPPKDEDVLRVYIF